ncbi:hypothetical protein ACJZ2D_004470 [Fusarium nematophilum]
MAGRTLGRGEPPRDEARLETLPCSLLLDDSANPGSWKTVLFDSSTVSLVKHGPANAAAYLGFRLAFPRLQDTSAFAWYGPSLDMEPTTKYEITCRFPQQFPHRFFTFESRVLDDSLMPLVPDGGSAIQALTIKLLPGHNSTIIGYGLPFQGETEEVDGWVNNDSPIRDAIALTDLLQQREFTFLIRSPADKVRSFMISSFISCSPFDYGYGNHHYWDTSRYDHVIPRSRGPAFEPKVTYDNQNQRDTALTQMHVQDKIGDQPIAKTKRFVCLLEPGDNFTKRHWRAVRRALTGNLSNLTVRLYPPFAKGPGPNCVEPRCVEWEAVHIPHGSDDLRGVYVKDRIALGLTRPHSGPFTNFFPFAYNDYKTAKVHSENTLTLHFPADEFSESQRVGAVNLLSNDHVLPPLMATDPLVKLKKSAFNELLVGQGLWKTLNTIAVDPPATLPTLNLLRAVSPEIREACLALIAHDDRERFRRYFSKLYLGFGLVSSPPGMGKSHLASVIAVLFCLSESFGSIYVSCSSNSAIDNILDRIDNVSQDIVGKLIASGSSVKHLMAMRGYRAGDEVGNCLKALDGEVFEEKGSCRASPWRFERSLCWWTLRVLGSKAVPCLSPNDCSALWDLHQDLTAYALGHRRDPTDKRCLGDFENLVNLAQGATHPEERDKNEPDKNEPDPRIKVLQRLMTLVIECANVVATTPLLSQTLPYCTFRSLRARAVVIDEAGTMFRADGLMVLGNTPRPMIAVGDPKQLAPNLSSSMDTVDGWWYRGDSLRHPINRFAGDAKISWLSWFIHLGFPAFHLYTQHRMANGQFDLSLETVYSALKRHFRYNEICRPINFPVGLKVEQYIQAQHELPSASPDKLQAVFFDCEDCPCRKYPDSDSRLNPRQADCMAKYLAAMVKALDISPADIAVITPYRANLRAIQRRFRDFQALKDIVCSTVGTFQGREAEIVVLSLCVTSETGPCFAADERRLNVAMTRQKSSLFIFGDINTTEHSSCRQVTDKESSGKTVIDAKIMRKVFRMIRESGRVVKMKGDSSFDPDSNW